MSAQRASLLLCCFNCSQSQAQASAIVFPLTPINNLQSCLDSLLFSLPLLLPSILPMHSQVRAASRRSPPENPLKLSVTHLTLLLFHLTVSRTPLTARPSVVARMTEDNETPVAPTVERGVSVDQDGKSNVWAIEPKSNSMEEVRTRKWERP